MCVGRWYLRALYLRGGGGVCVLLFTCGSLWGRKPTLGLITWVCSSVVGAVSSALTSASAVRLRAMCACVLIHVPMRVSFWHGNCVCLSLYLSVVDSGFECALVVFILLLLKYSYVVGGTPCVWCEGGTIDPIVVCLACRWLCRSYCRFRKFLSARVLCVRSGCGLWCGVVSTRSWTP